jgi:hypothetical protein
MHITNLLLNVLIKLVFFFYICWLDENSGSLDTGQPGVFRILSWLTEYTFLFIVIGEAAMFFSIRLCWLLSL